MDQSNPGSNPIVSASSFCRTKHARPSSTTCFRSRDTRLINRFCFATVPPDNGEQVLLLLRAKVIVLSSDLAVHVASVEHQHFVLHRLWPGSIQKPKFAWHSSRVEEVRSNGDHRFNIARFNPLLTHLRFISPSTGRLRGHDESGSPFCTQVAPEVTDPYTLQASQVNQTSGRGDNRTEALLSPFHLSHVDEVPATLLDHHRLIPAGFLLLRN